MADKYGSLYDRIIKYQITAVCREPLHVGGNDGRDGGILIHPVKNVPFIQATGIAGAMRDYLAGKDKEQNELFGASAGKVDGVDAIDCGSKVRVSDAFFTGNVVNTELRPRVKIDRETGTGQSEQTKGSQTQSGQKFETESVSAGSEFTFQLYLYEREHELEAVLEQILGALHTGVIQLGGQKSNGCGYIYFSQVLKSDYDMTKADDRKAWAAESKPGESILDKLETQLTDADKRLHFELTGEVDSAILVKSIAVRDYGEEALDTEQMRTADGKLVIPATSIKGVVRSQMEKIAKFKGLPETDIEQIFGKNSEKGKTGFLGHIHFFDAILEGGERPAQKRIHIDKFTGGVMYGELFSETPAYGKLTIRVDLEKEDKKAAGLVLMALRDLGIGILPLGSGSSIGRGYISGTGLQIKEGTDVVAKIDLKKKQVETGANRIAEYLKAV